MNTLTLKDVSRKSGFSVSTVSMVLNDRRDVSIPNGTREAVKVAAEEIGYVPRSPNGRGKLSKAIAILTFEDLRTCFENPYFAEIYAGIEEMMEEQGYHTLFKRLQGKDSISGLEMLRRGRVDGIFVLGSPRPALLEGLEQTRLPVVFVNATVDSRWDSVIPDFEDSFEMALRILKDSGHRRMLCLKTAYADEKVPYVSEHLRRAIQYVGLREEDVVIVKTEDDSAEAGYQAMKGYLAEHPQPDFTAAFSGHSKPFGMVRALREAGLSVPNDVSVIAIGGDPYKTETTAQISTVLYPLRQVGREGVIRLLQKVQGLTSSPCKIVLPVRYEDHGTVAKI